MSPLAGLEQNRYIALMPDDPQWNAALDPRFFDGRILIDILAWDWNLRVAVAGPSARPKSRFQSGLIYGRDFKIQGRVRAPSALRGKSINITLSPFGPKVLFGRNGLKEVGRLSVGSPGQDIDFAATLMLPESAIPSTATSLASAWKHLDLWTFEETNEGARISAFSFSAAIHGNLLDWANGD
jgi:putative cofactor-binding repeat protein